MKKDDILVLTVKGVRFHKEERMQQGDMYGNYSSNYVASFVEYPNGIAVVDSFVASMHPNWNKKTENRTAILSKELTGRKVSVRVTNIFAGKDTFEGILA